MRTTFKLLISLTLFSSCQENNSDSTDAKPVYFDYENSWEERNLFGKVKSVSTYRANYKSDTKLDEKRLQRRTWFTKFGAIKRAEYFETFGQKTQTESYEYDENKYFIKAIIENFPAKRKIIRTVKDDTINKITSQKIYINNNLTESFIVHYDKNGRIEKHLEIEDNDTIEYIHNLKLDAKKNLISERQISSNSSKDKVVDSFAYDKDDRLIYSSNLTNSTEFISIFEWKDDKLISEKNYFVYPDETKHLNSLTEYDNLYNPTNITKYTDEKPSQEYKYEYTFDQQNNWIKQTVYIKQIRNGKGDFVKAYADSREIEYW